MEIALIIIGAILLALFGLYLFAIGTKRSKEIKKYARHKYAHRGLHSETVAENSMTTFRLAVEGGWGIELDVRLSRDKQLVVFHDDTLDRVVGREGRVSDFTAEELSKMSLLGTDDGIPLFDDVLNLVCAQVPLLVEIKEDQGSSEVSTLVAERLSTYMGDFIIESFNPLSLQNIKKRLPQAERGILSHKYYAYEPYRKPLFAMYARELPLPPVLRGLRSPPLPFALPVLREDALRSYHLCLDREIKGGGEARKTSRL